VTKRKDHKPTRGRQRIDPSEPTKFFTLRLPASVVEAIRVRKLRAEITRAVLEIVRGKKAAR
jgi:hypothetical protein